MKLQQLHLFEERCQECSQRLDVDDISAVDRRCQKCRTRREKEIGRQDSEEANKKERGENAEANLVSVSQQMPDRSYDKERGGPGWLSGEPSPGRSS